jgi:hypothetical protein
MVMKTGLPVFGTVTDPEGKPVANARVFLGEWYSPPLIETSTDHQGHYRFASLAPGDTVLTVVKAGLAPGLRSLNVQSRMKPVDFQLEKGNPLRVRVVGRDGKPIPGVFVTPDSWRGKRVLCDLDIRGRTDAEGRWTWTWAPQDTVLTDFGLTGRVNYISIHHRPLVAQEAEHVVTLDPALTISGHVIDAQTKQPVPSFRVVHGYIPGGDSDGKTMFWDRLTMVQGKNGEYQVVVTGPSPGHVVRIEADGYQPATSRQLRNDEGSVTCDFTLTQGKILNISVRLPDGKSAAGADVSLCPEKPGKYYNMATFVKNGQFAFRSSFDPTALSMKVRPDGRLPIEPQDNGFVLIVVHDQGLAQTTSEELAAKPEITLTAWARLEGVVRRGTKPVPNAKLDAYPNESFSARWGFLNFQDQTEADAAGKFVFSKLKPGKWRVRVLPVDQSGRSSNEKPVELAPGQTVHVTLGGEGRTAVGRIRWPGGKLPERDLLKIVASVQPQMPEMPPPPREVRDQGPNAVRAWMKGWGESEEGNTRRRIVEQQQAERPRSATVSRDGALRIEGIVPGQYELGVYVMVKEDTLPWERSDSLRYTCDFTVPEIRGGVSDEPLDLGNVQLTDRTPKKISSAPAKPPAPQAAGEKTVGGLRDNLELLRYVATTYKENKAKVQTWQGKASVQSRTLYEKGARGQDYSATVHFVFDRAGKSVRWNNTLEKWSRIANGQEDPQPVPQITNGMVMPEAFYRYGSYGSPGNPANRPLTLTIASFEDPFNGRIQPQLYDFNPLYYLETSRGDVARDLSGYIAMADDPRLGRIKVIREGDRVTIDMGMDDVQQYYTVSLNRGCNPIHYGNTAPGWASQYRWVYELRDGIWLPKTWTETVHEGDRRDEERKVTFVENRVNQPVEPAAFSLPRLGVQRGDKVQDRRTQPVSQYQYEGE